MKTSKVKAKVERGLKAAAKLRAMEDASAWLQTFTGRAVEPGDFKVEHVDRYDIAHALSHVCRFTGHVSRFYSVAEHSILVASVIDEWTLGVGYMARGLLGKVVRTPKGQAVAHGLMHDASEAFLADIAAPVKRLPAFAEYRKLEEHVQSTIESAFGIYDSSVTLKTSETLKISALTKRADLIVLKYEAARLMLPPPKDWALPDSEPWQSFECLRAHAAGWTPREAYPAFVRFAADLGLTTEEVAP